MLMLMQCKSIYVRLTPRVLHGYYLTHGYLLMAAVKFYSSNALCSAYSGKSRLLTVDKHNVIFMIIQGPFLLNFPSFFV